jgi:branched-chain amino acid transport system substrate-binding protein
MVRIALSAAAVALLAFTTAQAQEVRIGLTGTFTGPNAAVGAPYKQAADIFPATLGGVPVKWIVLDDAGDASTAVKNARKFVDEDKVDAIVGSTSTPTATAIFDVAAESRTPQFAMAPTAIPADPAKRAWLFSLPQPVPIMVSALVDDMKKRNVKRVGFIGFSDGWGDLNYNVLMAQAKDAGIQVVAAERYNRTDTSVVAQALKVLGANPDAIYLGAAATPATLPHRELKDQGFKGQIYHTHGTISKPFLDAGGRSLEGAIAPTGPLVVASGLPDSNPIKKVALDFITKFQAKYGAGMPNPFAGYSWDAMLLLDAAVPDALKKAKPGTPEFRAALRDSLISGREVVGTHAVYKYSDADRYGVDARSRVLVTVQNGTFVYYQ